MLDVGGKRTLVERIHDYLSMYVQEILSRSVVYIVCSSVSCGFLDIFNFEVCAEGDFLVVIRNCAVLYAKSTVEARLCTTKAVQGQLSAVKAWDSCARAWREERWKWTVLL